MPQLMSDIDARLIVDPRLGAVPVGRLLEVREQLRAGGRLEPSPQAPDDQPVLEGEQPLAPDVLYPAKHDPALRWYLPRYRVQVDRGRPMVELRYDPQAAAGAPVGTLSLTLGWTPPTIEAGQRLRTIDHTTTLALRYRVAIDGAGATQSGEGQLALQPLQAVGDGTARSVTPVADKALFDAVYQALRSPAAGTTLELSIRARVGVRTWRQVPVGRVDEIDQAVLLRQRAVLNTDTLRVAQPVRLRPGQPLTRVQLQAAAPRVRGLALEEAGEEPRPRAMAQAMAAMQRPVGGMRLDGVAGPVLVARPVSPIVAAPIAARPIVSVPAVSPVEVAPGAIAAPIAAPIIARPLRPRMPLEDRFRPDLAEAVSGSDLQVGGRRVVPTRIALDRQRRPAVVDAELSQQQSLPFVFDPREAANVGVFVAPAYTEAIHLLLPVDLVHADGHSSRVYRDNLMPEVLYLVPSEFRLQRERSAPYLPDIGFLLSDVGTPDEATSEAEPAAAVLHRVAVPYRLEAWVDPEVVRLAQAQTGQPQLRFSVVLPDDASLHLTSGPPGVEGHRAGARVRDGGLDDTLDLEYAQFERLWREQLAPAGAGLTGSVAYRHFDGTPVSVPVRMSLWSASGELFDVADLGPVEGAPTRRRVQLRNRIESPVRLVELPPEPLPGALAQPLEAAAVLDRVLAPREALTVDYELGAAAATTADFDPSAIGRAEPDLSVLLKRLMVTSGYASLGFRVPVKAADGAFAPPARGDALMGLKVEFDDGSSTTLLPSLPQAEVSLLGRMIDQLLGQPDVQQRYFYRVTNLHASGEGARSGWLEGQGTAPLAVGTAQGGLDF